MPFLHAVLPALWLLFHVEASSSPLSANCPESCECNRTTIVCVDAGFTSTDVFLSFKDSFFDALDTLIVRGNNFGEIEGSNLFGPGVRHRSLSLIDLSHNNITLFDATAFEGVPNLEFLDLTRNRISQIRGNPLAGKPRLKTVSLTAALDPSLSPVASADLVHQLFAASNNTELREVHLEINGLVYLPKDTFCRLPALESLGLSKNRLSSVQFNPLCMQSLRSLYLSDNQLTNIGGDALRLISTLSDEFLNEIDISGNPFRCDCHLGDLVQFFWDKRDIFVRKRETRCKDADPLDYVGFGLGEVERSQLRCPRDAGMGYLHTIYVFMALSLIGLCLLVACVVYGGGRRVCLRLRKGKVKYELVGGYKQLSRADEADVPPEFV